MLYVLKGSVPLDFQRDREQLRETYAPHAAIGNWDVIMEHDNVLHRPSGQLTYVDLGGTGASEHKEERKPT